MGFVLAVMLALVASIHVLVEGSTTEDVDGRDKPDHDGKGAEARRGTLSWRERAG